VTNPPAPRVSVIVPAFNAEWTIRRALESAARQSWRNIEIVIVDDGSTDRTGEIAAAFCADEKRARLIRQPNGGESAARNRAISEATGEWIAPLDADDLWHPDKIERQLEAARRIPEAGLVYCWSRLIDADDEVIGTAPEAELEGKVLLEHLGSNFVGNGSTPLISTLALGDLRYNPDFDACADYLLQLQLAMRTLFAVVPAFLTGYRLSATNTSSDALRMIRGHVRMFEFLIQHLNGGERAVAERQLSRWRARLGLVLLRRGQARDAASHIAKSLGRAPAAACREILHQVRVAAWPGGQTRVESGGSFFDLVPEQP